MAVLNLARSYTVEVAAYSATAPTTWTPFNGINDFTYAIAATLQSTDTYDTDGWASSEKTMQTWSATVKAFRPITGTAPGAFDAGQEIVRSAQDQFGTAARVWVQFFNKDGLDEAWNGIALVDWSQSKSAVADVQEITVKFTGDGVLNALTVPVAP